MLFRNVFNFLAILPLLKLKGLHPVRDLPEGKGPTMYLRGFLGLVAYGLFAVCLTLIPISLTFILMQTSPFWTSIIAYWVNKEPIFKYEYVAMVVCFSAVIYITFSKPHADEADISEDPVVTDEDGTSDVMTSKTVLGVTLAFVLAWLFALCNVINRVLKAINWRIVMFYHALVGLTLSLTAVGIEAIIKGEFRTYTWEQYGLIVVTCIFDFGSVNSQTIAFQFDSSGFVALTGYISIVYAFMADILIFKT